MSRLTDLIRQVAANEPQLAADLSAEVKALGGRRAFGLNFERHAPEVVELPGRRVRAGEKVRVLPPRGSTARGDQRLWQVMKVRTVDGTRVAHLVLRNDAATTAEAAADDLVVIAEFRDPIYPGLRSMGRVERGGDKPFHTVINAENYHALKTLLYTHSGKVDAICIDPPYNTGARDWKYDNDYVDSEDRYRHSKWLAFMERRLLLAKGLLNPDASALIVTIDEKEVHRLGLLLRQMFPECTIQMISSVINPKGVVRANEFSRTDEYVFFVLIGGVVLMAEGGAGGQEVPWQQLRRTDIASRRGTKKGGPAQFYPVYVNRWTGAIESLGDPILPNVDRFSVADRAGCVTVFPLRDDGTEMNWGLTRKSLQLLLDQGFVKAGGYDPDKPQPFSLKYLTSGRLKDIREGNAAIVGYEDSGAAIVRYREDASQRKMATTAWARTSHNAQYYGTELLRTLLPGRSFPFPKSIYAVEDALRFVVGSRPDATVVDFFAGSGTTAHAVMRLNRQDGGRRQSICVTNNEVSADEQTALLRRELRPGDPDWEEHGICRYITQPRITTAVTGCTPSGPPVQDDYKFTDEFPISEGFDENVEFFDLTYEDPRRVSHNRAFTAVAPLLWLRAGSVGRRIETVESGWDVADTYGVLADLDKTAAFLAMVSEVEEVKTAFVVTDDDRRFQMVCAGLPHRVDPIQLYESYLRNFEIVEREP